MWQVRTLAEGERIVASTLLEGVTVLFERRGNPIVYMSMRLDGGNFVYSTKLTLPIITVDRAQILDLNECIEAQRELTEKNLIKHDYCFATDRSVGLCVWSGEEIITPSYPIWKIMHGDTLHIKIVFEPFVAAEYNLSLSGLADVLLQTFGISTSEVTANQAGGQATGSAPQRSEVSIDRAAIRSMVEDFWRSFISVAVSNPQISAQTIQHFEERIQATASLMAPGKARMFLQATEQERDILFNEYNRNPDALKRRLGLAPAPVNRPNLLIHRCRRQSIGEMVVRTAIRATIWETVISLFRGFR